MTCSHDLGGRRPAARVLALALLAAASAAGHSTLAHAADPREEASSARSRALSRLSEMGRVERSNATGLARFVRLHQPAKPGPGVPPEDPEVSARAFVKAHAAAFGLDVHPEIETKAVTPADHLGARQVRFRQTHRGLPVTGAELIVHLVEGAVVAVNGRTIAADDLEAVSRTPAVSAAVAREVVRQLVVDRHLGVAVLSSPRLELFNRGLFEDRSLPTRLAWFVEARATQALQYVWVNAQDGRILLDFNQRPDARDRRVYTASNTETLPGSLVRAEAGPATGDADVDSVYEFLGDTYDYFLSEHARDGIDGSGAPIVATTHFGVAYQNAFWDPDLEQLAFGDGVGRADDVVAHEYAHGVTQHTADLYYYKQSGALNESFSDIFGETVDLLNGAGTDSAAVRWLAAEDWAGVGPVRNMMDPTAMGDPGKLSDPQLVCGNWDNGGVHYNSGILNHAYALMVDGGSYNGRTVTGVGLQKAGVVAYRALSTYLTALSDMQDTDTAFRESCSDLVTAGTLASADCVQVGAALDAVELGDPWPCDPKLAVTKSGTGTGRVVSSPAGIDCGAQCESSFAAGTAVTLTPTPDAGSVFVGWRDSCSGAGSCSVTVTGATAVGATFDLVGTTHDVAVSVTGNGTVTSAPAGIDCGSDCSESFGTTTTVTLTATPAPGWTLQSWGGACSGAGSCVLYVDGAKNVTATFVQGYTLAVSRLGSGSGTVVSSPPAINCGPVCTAGVAAGTVVTLQAFAGGYSAFAGWGGDCSGTAPCTFAMDGDRTVTATFTVPTYPLSVTVNGNGTVTSSPAGINCGGDCSEEYAAGTTVTLTAAPGAGAAFAGWEGACFGTGPTCSVTMAQASVVSATFSTPEGTLVPAADRVDMVYDGRRDVVYVTDGGLVRRYAVSAQTYLDPIALGGTLGGIDLSPDGRMLAVATQNAVGVWLIDPDTLTRELVNFEPAFSETSTYTVAFAADGTLYTTSRFGGSGWVPFRRYDPATGTASVVFEPTQDTMLAASGDGTVIGFAEANISDGPWGRYRVADGSLVERTGYTDGTSAYNFEVGVNHDASQYAIPTYGGTYIYDAGYARIGVVGQYAGPQPIGVAYHPVENLAYFPWAGTRLVNVVDTNTLAIVARHDVGYTFDHTGNEAFLEGRTRISRDGSLLMVTVGGGVRVVRLYAPLQASGQNVTTSANTPVPITLGASIGNGGALSYRIVSGPPNGVLSGTAPNLTYTPAPGFVGQDAFTFVAAYGLAETRPQAVVIGVSTAIQPQLLVDKAGAGSGTVTSTPGGISCGSQCRAVFPSGTSVTLVAAADAGSYFWGWTGACSGLASCTITMDQHRFVSARFETRVLPTRLSVSTTGLGKVVSSPAGISCGTDCSEDFAPGTEVTLTAEPGPGYSFAGWGGACSGTAASCTVTTSSSLSVTASFSGSTVGTLVPAANRMDMVYDERRDVLYISNAGSVLRYQVGSGTFLPPFTLGGALGGIDLSPDGTRLAVAAWDSVSVWLVDLRTEDVRQVPFTPGSGESALFTVAFGADGTLYTTSRFNGSGWVPFRKYDPATGAVSVVFSPRQNTMLAASGDGTVIGFAEANSSDGPWGRYRVADGNLVRRTGYTNGTSAFNFEIGVNRDASQYAIPTSGGTQFYDGSYLRTRTIGTTGGAEPIGVSYHPVENAVYFPFAQTSVVRVYDTMSLTQIGEYNFGYTFGWPGNAAFQSGRTRLSRDGSLLMVTVGGGVRVVRLYAPLQASGQDLTTPLNTPLAITLAGSIGNGGGLTYRVVAAPLHGHLTGVAPNLVYEPDPGFVGQDSFTFVAAYGLAETVPQVVAIGVGEAVQPTVSVTKIGAGAGTVTSTPPGISCGSSCRAGYPSGTLVTLVAAAAEGSYFWGWTGACGGLADCTVTVDRRLSVTAHFEREPLLYPLSVSTTGLGTVSSSPAGLFCGPTCSHRFEPGTEVTLTAEPGPGYSFAGWDGACSGTATSCTVTMSLSLSVTASFSGSTVGTLVPASSRVDMVYDERRDVLYISNGDSVLRYQVGSGTFLSPFTLGGTLGGIDLSPDGTRLAVAAQDSVSLWLVDLRTDKTQQVLFTPGFAESALFTVAFGADGTLYTTSRFSGSGTVPFRRYDPATGAVSIVFSPNQNTMLAPSGDGTVIGFAEANSSGGPWGRYRVADGSLVRRQGYDQGTSAFNFEIGVNRDASQYAIPTYYGTYVYDGSYLKTRTIGTSAGAEPIGVGYHPVENAVYFPFAQTSVVRVYDTVSLAQVGEFNFGYAFGWPGYNAFQSGRTRLSRDGSLLMVTVGGGVRVVRLYAPLQASGQDLTTPLNTPLPITLTGSIGNGGTLSYRIVSGPANGVLTGSAPNVAYTPAPGFVGQDAFTFVAAYGLAETVPQVVAIGVGEAVQPTVSVTKIGAGEGTVTSTPPGISCGSSCRAGYPSGTVVTLVAEAAEGSYFWGWSGACGGLADCTVTVDQHLSVAARFEREPLLYPLSVSTTGLGTVSSSPAGLFCGPTCSHRFEPGTEVTLTAEPGPGYSFAGWGGACSGTAASCTVTMDSSLSVTASFSGSTVGTLVSAANRMDMVYDGRRDVLYVSNADSVLRYRVGTGTFLTPFTLGGTLGGIDLSPDGTRLAVAARDSVSVWLVDLRTENVQKVSFTPAFGESSLFTVAFGRDGTLYTTSRYSGSGWVPFRKYDPLTGAVNVVFSPRQDTMLAPSGDGTVIGFAEANSSDGPWGRYRVADGNLVRRQGYEQGTSTSNFEIGVNRDASQYAIPTYYGTYVYDGSYLKTRTIGTYAGAEPIGVSYHPVENAVYFPFAQTSVVRVYDTTSLARIGEYNFGGTFSWTSNTAFQSGRTRLSRDGSLLMVTVGGGVRIVRLYAPLQASGQDLVTTWDTPLPISLAAGIGNGGTLSYRIVSGPSNGVLSGGAPSLTYTPAPGFVGQDSFTFVAAYGLAETVPQLVTIRVDSPPGGLTVAKLGDGSGMVTSIPAGIDCGATCAAAFAEGTSVTLTATPGAGSGFAGWNGAGCSGTGTCVLTMDAPKSVTATFSPLRTLAVTLVGAAAGRVTSTPAGIDCGSACSAPFLEGSEVTLTAAPGTNVTFLGWGGACEGFGPATVCTVAVDSDETVSAAFASDLSGELTHGSSEWHTLAARAGAERVDRFLVAQQPWSSYEVLVEGVSGDVVPVQLERVGEDGSTVLPPVARTIGPGGALSLRWRNDGPSAVTEQTIRVRSGGCSTDCGADDVYRIRFYETTGSIARFNNVGSQVTVVVLQNPTDATITGSIRFWDAAGSLLASSDFTLGAKQTHVLNSSSLAALAGKGGAITIAHDGGYGNVVGKAVVVEATTGFSFDTPMVERPR